MLSNILNPRSQSPIVIHTTLSYNDIGNTILKDWKDKTMLLSLTLELHSFLEQGLYSCWLLWLWLP